VERFRLLTHALIVAFAIPIARVIRIQPSVIVMAWMCVLVYRAAMTRAHLVDRAQAG
jgi:hypothetical protein